MKKVIFASALVRVPQKLAYVTENSSVYRILQPHTHIYYNFKNINDVITLSFVTFVPDLT